MASELKFDLDKLGSSIEKCKTICKDLEKMRNDYTTLLENLRKEWNTPAGKKFFEEQNDEWAEQVQQYLKITGAVQKLLEAAQKEYGKVVEAANALKLG